MERSLRFIRILYGCLLVSLVGYAILFEFLPPAAQSLQDSEFLNRVLIGTAVFFGVSALALRFVLLPKLARRREPVSLSQVNILVSVHILSAVLAESVGVAGVPFGFMTGLQSRALPLLAASAVLLILSFPRNRQIASESAGKS